MDQMEFLVTNSSNSTCCIQEDSPYFMLTALLLLCGLGIFGNTLVIVAVICVEKLRNVRNLYVLNLAIADLIVTGFHMPLEAFNLAYGTNYFTNVVCKISALSVVLSCVSSIMFLCAIAVKRYIFTMHRTHYKTFFKSCSVKMHVIGIWILCMVISLLPLVGFGRYGYYEYVYGCLFDLTETSFALFMCSILVIMVLLSCSLYVKIFMTYIRLRNALPVQPRAGNIMQLPSVSKAEVKKSIAFFVVILGFVIFWTPYIITQTIHIISPGSISSQILLFVGWMGMSNSCINFMIYGIAEREFKRGYYFLWRKISCEKF